jgi:hypothetical protein
MNTTQPVQRVNAPAYNGTYSYQRPFANGKGLEVLVQCAVPLTDAQVDDIANIARELRGNADKWHETFPMPLVGKYASVTAWSK